MTVSRTMYSFNFSFVSWPSASKRNGSVRQCQWNCNAVIYECRPVLGKICDKKNFMWLVCHQITWFSGSITLLHRIHPMLIWKIHIIGVSAMEPSSVFADFSISCPSSLSLYGGSQVLLGGLIALYYSSGNSLRLFPWYTTTNALWQKWIINIRKCLFYNNFKQLL